jgi:hypothetical protein
MYGKWFTTVMAIGGVVLLVVGLMTAFAALIAVGIAAVAAAVFLYASAARRGSQVGGERRAAADERRRAGQHGRPTASAAPRAGEGDVDAAHSVRTTGRAG